MSDPQADGPPKVFLSYATADRSVAVRLDAELRARGIRTYLDSSEDRPDFDEDEMLPEPILQQLGWCDVLLALWSRAASESGWVEAECRMAREFGKELLAYRLDGTPPPSLDGPLPVVEKAGDPDSIDELLRALHVDGGHRESAGPPGAAVAIVAGRWHLDITDLAGRSSRTLDLTEDGHLKGETKVKGLSGTVSGTWSYHPKDGLLKLEMETRVGLRPNTEVLQIQLTGRDGDALLGEDRYDLGPGRRYTLTKVDGAARGGKVST
jgi:hypothetical protein